MDLPDVEKLTLKQFLVLLASGDYGKLSLGQLLKLRFFGKGLQMGSDGVWYTPLCSGGYPPKVDSVVMNHATAMTGYVIADGANTDVVSTATHTDNILLIVKAGGTATITAGGTPVTIVGSSVASGQGDKCVPLPEFGYSVVNVAAAGAAVHVLKQRIATQSIATTTR